MGPGVNDHSNETLLREFGMSRRDLVRRVGIVSLSLLGAAPVIGALLRRRAGNGEGRDAPASDR